MKAILATAAMLMAIINNAAFAADSSTTQQPGIQVSGSSTFTMRGTIPKVYENTDNNPPAYKLSLKLIKEFENNGKIEMRIKGDSGTENNIKITELFYQQSFLNNKLTADFGKLNFGTYFAGNEYTSQFITEFFSSADKTTYINPSIIALRLNYTMIDIIPIDIAYAYFVTCFAAGNELDLKKGADVLQATYKPSNYGGNYRLYMWTEKKGSQNSRSRGIGLSADQEINKEVGVFARLVYSSPLHSRFSYNIGIRMKGLKWTRTDDTAGLAIGKTITSSETQHLAELYYRFKASDNIAITGSIQCFSQNKFFIKDKIVYGIRTVITF